MRSVRIIDVLLILLLLTACGAKDDTPQQPDSPASVPQTDTAQPEEPAQSVQPEEPSQPEEPVQPELEETVWEVNSPDIEALDLSGGLENPDFEYIFNHTDTVPLDQLVAFSLAADALSEGATDELYHRFLDAPHKVLTYLESLGDQVTELPGWEPMPTAEIICKLIAATDAAMYGGTEDFTQTLAACREAYPEGRVAELLDALEREHTAAMERR